MSSLQGVTIACLGDAKLESACFFPSRGVCVRLAAKTHAYMNLVLGSVGRFDFELSNFFRGCISLLFFDFVYLRDPSRDVVYADDLCCAASAQLLLRPIRIISDLSDDYVLGFSPSQSIDPSTAVSLASREGAIRSNAAA